MDPGYRNILSSYTMCLIPSQHAQTAAVCPGIYWQCCPCISLLVSVLYWQRWLMWFAQAGSDTGLSQIMQGKQLTQSLDFVAHKKFQVAGQFRLLLAAVCWSQLLLSWLIWGTLHVFVYQSLSRGIEVSEFRNHQPLSWVFCSAWMVSQSQMKKEDLALNSIWNCCSSQ